MAHELSTLQAWGFALAILGAGLTFGAIGTWAEVPPDALQRVWQDGWDTGYEDGYDQGYLDGVNDRNTEPKPPQPPVLNLSPSTLVIGGTALLVGIVMALVGLRRRHSSWLEGR